MERQRNEPMILTMFMLAAGYYRDSWRRPGSRSEELGYIDLLTDLAQMAERAKLDAVFFGDISSAETILRGDNKISGLYEPITAMSALAGRTTNIGLIGTMSTTFNNPYNVARQFSGLDSLSGGRAGWNIVTSFAGNENYGMDEMPERGPRYRRAAEFVDICQRLWDSWEDDAVINDRESGWWVDTDKLHAIDHDGEFFKVAGPLNMRRSPQGRPVLIQAGKSADGMDLGASVGDGIYTAQPYKPEAIGFYNEFKQIVRSKGRDPEGCKIIPGVLPIVGETDAEAEEIAEELAGYVHMDIGRAQMQHALKIDMSELDLDKPIPLELFDPGIEARSRQATFRRQTEEGATLRDLIISAARSYGHQWLVGSPSTIADVMVDWFESYACDGFSLNPPYSPDGFERICTLLVPELQNRGYFREEYEGTTLRDNFGLTRPPA